MNKKLFLILILGLALLFLPDAVFGGVGDSQVFCGCTTSDGQCGWVHSILLGGIGKSCLLKTTPEISGTTDDECSDSNTKCRIYGCPHYSGWNGADCYLRANCWFACEHWGNRWEADEANLHEVNLKWNASGMSCVKCVGNFKTRVYAETGELTQDRIYVGCDDYSIDIADVCESACGADSACDEKSPGDPCGTNKECNSSCECVTAAPTCSEACHSAGYDNGLCFYGSTSCSAQGYPYSYNQYCHHNCSSKTGTSCDGTCLCSDTDSNKPSCNYYSSGSTCYYDGTADCTNSGWDCDYDTCNMRECCDCTASGCDPNDANCSTDFICDSNCYCQGPDLTILDVWFSSDRKVNYVIRNQGEAEADSSYSYLYTDGSYKTNDPVNSLPTNSSSYEDFAGWTCTAGQTYSIEVCADKAGPYGAAASGGGDVDEENENNNCLTETLDCRGECAGILNVSISGSGTCTVTASLTATLCSGKYWQVRDNGDTKCSGTVSGSPYYYTCSSWTVEAGSYLYRLYIDGVVKDGKAVNCSETPNEPPTCNYLNASPDSGNAPLSVSFTGSGSDSDGNIVEYQLDFDGNGTWDYTGSVSPAEPNPIIGYNYTYDNPGTYPAKIRFKDDDGTWSDVPSACTQVIEVTSFAEEALNPPVVITGEANSVEATSATLNGELVDLGYDPAECSSCSCIVWFEWGASGTEGVSGSYGNSTTPVLMTATDPFTEVISGLTAGQTYYFEAFAKNGGSW